MDAVRSMIVSRVAELGLSLSELSLKVGKNHAYFQQFVKRGVPNRLPEEVRGRVAEILGVEERLLKDLSMPIGPRIHELRTELVNLPRGGGWIPVYGQAVGGKDDEVVLNGNEVFQVLAPPILSHVPNAYAVYVVGDSMEPRYFAGEAVFVNPRLPIVRGSFVVAQISKGQQAEHPRAYIKRFLSQDAKRLRLEQFNPKKIFEFSMSTVVAVHRIVLSGDSR